MTIAKVNSSNDEDVVRIDACDGAALLARVELPLEWFAKALMGRSCVPAEFRTDRKE
ncbi:MAG: hypothetical protein JSR98_06690 [Proteobacteria bacterium]|nr:hypothetical protein [Pseudomonadota bacterium]